MIAVEAVLGVVEEKLPFRVRRGELSGACHRDRGVALAEMRHDSAFRLLATGLEHAAAVIRDSAGEAGEPGGAHPGDESAPAIADDADATCRRRNVARRGNVGESRLGAGPRLELATARDIFRGVADIEAALVSVEERRRDRHIAICREALANRTDVAVHPEDLLHDDQPAARLALPRRIGAVCRHAKPVRGGQVYPLAHRSFLLCIPGITHDIMLRAALALRPSPSPGPHPCPLSRWERGTSCAPSARGSDSPMG